MLFIPLGFIFYHIFSQGIAVISPTFLTHLPKPPGEIGGGLFNAIIGSVFLVSVASLMAIPVGIFAGIYLSEEKAHPLAYWVRICVDILQGTPSIVIGTIVYIWCVLPMGHFSALSGSIALAIMMLPVIVRATEETIKLVPETLREASLALGVPYHRTVLKVIVPSAFSGILTAILISVARVSGETAPLLFTAFGNSFLNFNALKPIAALPLVIFTYATSPYDDWHHMAWGASVLLVGFILTLSLVSKGFVKS